MPGTPKARIWAWALYDFANTIFSMNVITRYFGLWVTEDRGGTDTHVALAMAVAPALTLIGMPLFGLVSDRYRRRMPFLILSTLISVAATVVLGMTDRLSVGLAAFVLAYVGFQVGIVFYDALLPEVAGTPARIGHVSGYGVALGYLGAVLGLFLVAPFVSAGGHGAAFVPTAALFLLFSLPIMLFVRDRESVPVAWRRLPGEVAQAARRLTHTVRSLRELPGVGWFLLANFLYSDAVNTVINFMAIYAARVVNFSGPRMDLFLVMSTLVAVAASFGWGALTDRLGPRRVMTMVLVTWCAGLGLAAATPNAAVFWLVGPLVGAGLGGIWVAGRTLLIQLVPASRLGEFLGLYGLTEKSAAVLGPLVWALIVDHLFAGWGPARYRIAVLSLLGFVVLGLWVLRKVPQPDRPAAAGVVTA